MTQEYISIEAVQAGNSYACYFRTTTMLDELGRPAPNLSDTPLKGPGVRQPDSGISLEDQQQKAPQLSC